MKPLRPLMLAVAAAVTLVASMAAAQTGAQTANPVPAPGKAVFYGLHYIDTSIDGAINGVSEDETKRLKMTEELIAADLASRGFTVMQPPADKMAEIRNPVKSNGRDTKIAAEMGADYAISGQVQKVSNLILSIGLYVRDAHTAKTLRAGTVDIRGNNDESFRRGTRYLLKNIVFRTE